MSKPTPPASREREIYAAIQAVKRAEREREESLALQRASVFSPATWPTPDAKPGKEAL